jgi:hypothetical protein
MDHFLMCAESIAAANLHGGFDWLREWAEMVTGIYCHFAPDWVDS